MLIVAAADDPDPDPPVYREGYPEFDLAEAARRRKLSKVSVTWRNQYNHAVGEGAPEWISDFKVVVGYRVNLVSYLSVSCGTLVLTINWVLRGRFWIVSTDCRTCGAVATKLYLAGIDWLCAKCQGFGHRRNVMSKAASRSERLAELRAEVGGGRPSGMSDKVFLAKRKVMRELNAQVGGELVRAGPRHRAIIHADWFPDPKRDKGHDQACPPRRLVKPGFSDLP